MSEKTKAAWSLKSVFFSIRDAVAYRGATRDPGNRDITVNDPPNQCAPAIDTALKLSTVWACVRLISETIATLPLLMYQRDGEGRVLARDHPLFSLIHDSPNADMTAVEFWEAVVSQLCLWGNAYCLKSYGTGGKLVALDPLNPALMTVRRTLDGAVTYIYADPRGQIEYDEGQIWHIKGFGTDGLTGQSPIGMGWRSIRGAGAAETAASDMFANNMRPAATVSVKEWLKGEQRTQLKEKVMGAVFGNSQTGQLQLLEGDMQYKQLTMNPVDAQMIESRNFSVEDLCRWFNIPPSMIGHGTAVSNWGTGREQINLGFLQYVLRPYLVRIEQGIRKSLLRPAERQTYFAEYSMEGLLRGDSTARAAYYTFALTQGVLDSDEVRALENWPARGGNAAKLRVNAAQILLDDIQKDSLLADNATIAQENGTNTP